ncbi:MAG: WYL domain-containing protein [Thermomicrobiales bacterium]
MLLLGAGVMAASFDAQYRVAAANAARKIAAVLPEPIRRETQELRESVRFVPTRADVPDERLALLRRAIADRSPVRLRYHPRRPADGGSGATIRVIDPYVLARSAGSWYVTGHDHLRGTRRTFRLDRIEEIAVVGGRFERPPDAHVRHGERDVLPILIEALFAPEVARWVREDRSYFTEREEETAAGLIVTLRVRHERDVLSWLLGWGRHVRVLSPESLRALMRDEALALADAHAAPLPEGTADTLRGSVVGATSCVIVPADDDSRSARRDSSTPPAGSARNDGGGRRGSDNDAN